MVQRCTNPKHEHYERYKTLMYPPWQKFTTFLSDMGERPENTTLDRIDNFLGYSPENCRWADHKTQQRNKQSVILNVSLGDQIRKSRKLGASLQELAYNYEVSISTIKNVLYRGDWPVPDN